MFADRSPPKYRCLTSSTGWLRGVSSLSSRSPSLRSENHFRAVHPAEPPLLPTQLHESCVYAEREVLRGEISSREGHGRCAIGGGTQQSPMTCGSIAEAAPGAAVPAQPGHKYRRIPELPDVSAYFEQPGDSTSHELEWYCHLLYADNDGDLAAVFSDVRLKSYYQPFR